MEDEFRETITYGPTFGKSFNQQINHQYVCFDSRIDAFST